MIIKNIWLKIWKFEVNKSILGDALNESDELKESYFPTVDVGSWRSYISRSGSFRDTDLYHYGVVSNVAYNLQYLEYVLYQLKEYRNHVTVNIMLHKTFLTFGLSAIEGIFELIIDIKGFGKTYVWKEIEKTTSNPEKVNGKLIRKRIYVDEQCEPKPKKLTFHDLIQIAQSKGLFGLDKNDFKKLQNLREIRNKVHIQKVRSSDQTDFNSFNQESTDMVKKLLLSVLGSPVFEPKETDNILKVFSA